MKIVAISDTHMVHDDHGAHVPNIPDGDILIHSGDATFRGRPHEIYRFSKWFHSLPHKHKIFVAGNHDLMFEDDPSRAVSILYGDPQYWSEPIPNNKRCIYLQDNEVTIEGLRIYGAPWSPRFFDWAFNLDRGPAIKAKWDLIPEGIDILVTHGPPLGQGDLSTRLERLGCTDLMDAVNRVKPKIHIFGHIHSGYGISENQGTTFINASMCDETYWPANAPLEFTL